jgi:hypothetical protein
VDEREPGHPEQGVAVGVAEQIRKLVEAGEQTAAAIRAEAEREAEARLRSAETAADARLREADDEAGRVAKEAVERVERYASERIELLSRLSDDLLRRGEALLERIDHAAELRAELDALVGDLTTATREMRAQSAQVAVQVSGQPAAPEPAAAPEPEAEGPAEQDPAPSKEAEAKGEIASKWEAAQKSKAAEEDDERAAAGKRRTGRFRRRARADEESAEQQATPDHARLVALQMAVSGSSRKEVEHHLRNALAVKEPDAVLEDVFETQGRGT